MFLIGNQMEKYLSAVEQNKYLAKIVNVYIVYDLAAWPRNLTNNFKFKSKIYLEQLIKLKK